MASDFPPVPGGVTRGVVKAPNQSSPGDHRDGSFPLNEQGSPVTPPNHRFEVGMSKMPNPQSAKELGKGSIPVGAGIPGLPASSMRAKK